MTTESGWGDYLSSDGSSDLGFELSQAADVDQAASATYASLSDDLSATAAELPADPYAADAAWDASVDAGLAGDALDSAAANQEWADWHGEIAADGISSGQDHLEAAQAAAAAGDQGMVDYNLNAADIQFDGAADHATYAGDYADAVSYDVTEATGYEATAAESIASVETSTEATSYDTTSYDSASYDTPSYEAPVDTNSYDTTTTYDTTSYDTSTYDAGSTASTTE